MVNLAKLYSAAANCCLCFCPVGYMRATGRGDVASSNLRFAVLSAPVTYNCWFLLVWRSALWCLVTPSFQNSVYPIDEIAVPLCTVAVKRKVVRSRQDFSFRIVSCDRYQSPCTIRGAYVWRVRLDGCLALCRASRGLFVFVRMITNADRLPRSTNSQCRRSFCG